MSERRRFFAKAIVTHSCWYWTAGHDPSGYATFRWSGGRYAHRFAYEEFVGPIPVSLHIDHLCRNRGCVNPEHLEAVSSRENTLRGESPSAIAVRTGRYRGGHERTPENTYLWRGERRCRICIRTSKRARRARLGRVVAG